MQLTINIPDTLPPQRVRQRIKELEESMRREAEFLTAIAPAGTQHERQASRKLVALLDQGITLTDEECRVFEENRQWMERSWNLLIFIIFCL